jgi:predicted nucleic acid-binding protein
VPRAFHLRRALRRLKPEKRGRLNRRLDSNLAFAEDEEAVGRPLLLDTTVYLHVLRGETPEEVDLLLRTRTLYHSSVVIAELCYRIGARLPRNARERDAAQALTATVADMPAHRIAFPSPTIWGEAGILAGIRARTGGIDVDQRGLNDALIFLQGKALGAVVLTANLADFDVLQQIVPSGHVVFYRAA